MVNEWLQSLQQDVRSTLEKGQINVASLRRTPTAIEVRLGDPAKMQQALADLNGIANQVQAAALTASDLTIEATGADTLRVLPSEAGLSHRMTQAVTQSLEIIRQRVDQVGVAEPTIQRVGGDRVLVQLPGEQDPSNVRALLGSTAKMSFHLLGREGEPGITLMKDAEGRPYPCRTGC